MSGTYSRCLASDRAALFELAAAELAGYRAPSPPVGAALPQYAAASFPTADLDPTALRALYRDCLNRLRILARYPSPDWSIADTWVARELLATGTDPALVAAVLRHGSPGFARRHADPEDYVREEVAGHNDLGIVADEAPTLFQRIPRRIRSPQSKPLTSSGKSVGDSQLSCGRECRSPAPVCAAPRFSRAAGRRALCGVRKRCSLRHVESKERCSSSEP
jgi:hypothetical protein